MHCSVYETYYSTHHSIFSLRAGLRASPAFSEAHLKSFRYNVLNVHELMTMCSDGTSCHALFCWCEVISNLNSDAWGDFVASQFRAFTLSLISLGQWNFCLFSLISYNILKQLLYNFQRK